MQNKERRFMLAAVDPGEILLALNGKVRYSFPSLPENTEIVNVCFSPTCSSLVLTLFHESFEIAPQYQSPPFVMDVIVNNLAVSEEAPPQ